MRIHFHILASLRLVLGLLLVLSFSQVLGLSQVPGDFDLTHAQTNERTVGLAAAEGKSVFVPSVALSRSDESLMLLLEGSQRGAFTEKLQVTYIDSNRDGNCSDSEIRSSIAVGRSLAEGHCSHLDFSTSDWAPQTTRQVGGTTTRIIAVGG